MTDLRAPRVAASAAPAAHRRPLQERTLAALPSTAAVAVASLLLGGATSYGQLILPAWLAPLANAASPWVVFALAAGWLAAAPLPRSAALGALALVLVNTGYGIVSTARGYSYDPLDWNLIGLLVGPVVGLAAWGIRSRIPALVALGSGAIAAVIVGESLHGLITLGYPEQRGYWIVVDVLTAAWLGWLATARVRSPAWIGVQLLLVALVATGSPNSEPTRRRAITRPSVVWRATAHA